MAQFIDYMEKIEGSPHTCVGTARKWYKKLSYRKQIARKLCTQYVEDISANSVTLKSGLKVTQGHYRVPVTCAIEIMLRQPC